MQSLVPRLTRRRSLNKPVRICVLLEEHDVDRSQEIASRFGIPLSFQIREGLRIYHEQFLNGRIQPRPLTPIADDDL